MSVAKCLGVDDLDSPLMSAARAAWRGWVDADPGLGVVDKLADLPAWTKRAAMSERDAVLARLAELAGHDHHAAEALVWLLIPGATRLANSLRGLSPDIDELVAGQLWLEVRRHGGVGHAIATTILRDTRRAVMAECGCGDAARRQDRAWARTTVSERLDERATPVASSYGEPDAMWQLRYLVELMIGDEVLTFAEANLLASAATDADLLNLPLRGRAGITTPAAYDLLVMLDPTKSRTIRRRLVQLIERLAEYAREHLDVGDVQEWLDSHDELPLTLSAYLYAGDDPTKWAMIEKSNRVDRLIGQCPGLGLAGKEAAAARCGCARLGRGCLVFPASA